MLFTFTQIAYIISYYVGSFKFVFSVDNIVVYLELKH